MAAVIGISDPAGQHRAIGLQPLPGHDQAEDTHAREGRQVRASEGSGALVAVSKEDGGGTAIHGRPRPVPDQRRAT